MGVSDEQTTVSAEAVDGNGDAPPKPNKPLWKRLIKWTLVTLLVLVVLLGLGIAWLHTSMGQEFVRDRVETAVRERLEAQGGGSFTLGELDFALFGDVNVGKVTFADGRGVVDAEIASVAVVLDWSSLLSDRLVIESIAVSGIDATLTPKPAPPKPDTPPEAKPPPEDRTIELKSLAISDVNLTIVRPDGTTVRLSDVGVATAIVANAFTKKVALDTAEISVGAVAVRRPDGTTVDIGAFKTGVSATIDADKVVANWTGLDLTAKVKRAGETEVIDLPVKFAGIDVTRAGGDARLLVKGIVLGAVSLESVKANLNLDMATVTPVGEQSFAISKLHLTADDLNTLLGRKALLSDVDVDFTANGPPDKLLLKGTVDSKAGKLALSGTLDVSNPLLPVYTLKLEAPSVEPAKLLAGDFPETTTSMTVTIDGRGTKPGDMDTKLGVTIGATQVGDRKVEGVTIKAHAKAGNLVLDDFTLSVLGHEVKLDGDFDPETRTVKGSFKTSADLENLVKRIDEAGVFKAPLPPIKGQDVTVNMTARAVLKDPNAAAGPGVAADASAYDKAMARMPAEDATLKGTIKGRNLDDGRVKVGNLDIDVDFNVAKSIPKGTITVAIDNLETRTGLKLGKVNADVTVAGTTYTVEIKAEDKPTRRKLHVILKGTVDPKTLDITAELNKVLAQVGDFEATLARPVAMALPPGMDVLGKSLRLPTTTFNVAGGTVSVRGGVTLGPDKPPTPERMDADVEIKGVRLSKLPRQVRRRLRGVGGTLNGTLSVRGTPTDPAVSFSVNTRVRGFGVKASGGIADKRLDADVRLSRRGKRVLTAEVSAPLFMPPPGSKARPRLNKSGRLKVDVNIPEGRIADLIGGIAPETAKKLGNATLAMNLAVTGSAARPRVDMTTTLAGVPVEKLKKTIGGKVTFGLAPEGRQHKATGRLELQAEDGSMPPFGAQITALFNRSPVTARDKRPESAVIELFETDLAALLPHLPLDAKAREKIRGLTGNLDARIELARDGRKMMAVKATNTIKGLSLPGKLNPIDATMVVQVDSSGIKLTNTVDDGKPGSLGAFEFALEENPLTLYRLWKAMKLTDLMKTPLALRMTLPETPIARLRAISPLVPDLPGNVVSTVAIGGRLNAPTLSGALEYKGFDTLGGEQGRVALVLDSNDTLYSTALELGGTKKLVIRHTFDGPKAFDFYLGAEEKLRTKFEMTAPKLDVATLLPAFAVNFGKHRFEGSLQSDLVADLGFTYDDDFKIIPMAPKSTGSFRFEDGTFGIANTPRAFHDIVLAFSLDGGVKLDKLQLMESDEDKKNRTLVASGLAPMKDGLPETARFDIAMKDFLAIAPKFNSPEGEVTMKAAITASDLNSKVRKVAVDIAELKVHRPSRFVRDHYQQMTHLGDLFYLGEGHEKGKLPVIKPNPVLALEEPKPDEVTADIRVSFPKKAEILNFPLDFHLTGNLGVTLGRAGKDLRVSLACDVTFFDGTALVMGQPFKLAKGGMECPGPVRDFAAKFLFEKELPDPMKREQSQASAGGPATFLIVATAKGKPQTYPGGASGHYLIDAFSTLNAGRARLGSEPGHTASSTVQMPGGDEQPMVLTFLKTNLTHLVFLTRINLWAPASDLFDEYGKVRNLEGDAYWDGDRSRVRLLGHEPQTATSAAELRYDRILARDDRTLFGVGAYAGSNPGLGLELFVEWSSED